jgi:outer membrane lipoprotein-sorting protein
VVETKVESTLGNSPATKCRYDLASSKPKEMFTAERVLSPLRYEVHLGTDGNTVWAYSPTTKFYVIEANEIGKMEELSEELKRQHYRLFRRFEDLDRLDVAAVIQRFEWLHDEGRSMQCVRLRLLPRSNSGWSEEIWVDTASYLVRKSVFQKTAPMEVVTTTTRWRTIQLNGKLDPSVFRFVPTGNAKRTNQIRVP